MDQNNQPDSKSTTLQTRHTDVSLQPTHPKKGGPFLPPIPWNDIGQKAPESLPIGDRRPEDPLPRADWIVITWTSAEWFALDHVFLNSHQQGDASDHTFRKDWYAYTHKASDFRGETRSGELWGKFQMVQITDQSDRPWRVILFKSNAHLAHAPWIDGLSAMMRCIMEDSGVSRVYTIGTAGGARLNQSLGDAVITNSAVLKLQRPENVHDHGNGNSYRCPTWYPDISLLPSVQKHLLFKMNQVANSDSFAHLFDELREMHADDPSMRHISLDDLINEALSPESLASPKIMSLQDVPLLTTDFYYVANGNNSDAFSFLEMDDAVIAREANEMGVPFACIRNISDPIVPGKTKDGKMIPDAVRNDWSGLIYKNFGLYSSFNGALATWATIAGQGTTQYNPTRNVDLSAEDDPIEVRLAFQVRSCGTCNFFWPEKKKEATYGPYTAFDFDVSTPYPAPPLSGQDTYPWILGRTRPPAFPNGEIIDGCRKAPIMTLGINPNLTAFAPGQNGAPWAYPNFSSDSQTDAWTKYAWYYRYRSVYQEKLTLDMVEKYTLPNDQIIAEKSGVVTKANRPDESQNWTLQVRYENETQDTSIHLQEEVGDFPYMLFFDAFPPNNAFLAGDILAGKVAVPQGMAVEIMQKQQGYYMQFVPSLNNFQNYLIGKGHKSPSLQIGEDVSQIDMVACASPHWREDFLGDDLKEVVDNCVHKNGWAVKQIVQSRPSVLYVVSESSWNMFKSVFGNFVDPHRISSRPPDNAYTLLRETTNLDKPVFVHFNFTIDGMKYEHKIRLVITPHFSFSKNFLPQYRMSPKDFDLHSAQSDFRAAITEDNGFTIVPEDKEHAYYYRVIQLDPSKAEASRKELKKDFPTLFAQLEPYYYDPHQTMSEVLTDMYDKGELTYNDKKNYLDRTAGACRFCVNQHWQFKDECRYDKNFEAKPPDGFLEKVAAHIIKHGPPKTS